METYYFGAFDENFETPISGANVILREDPMDDPIDVKVTDISGIAEIDIDAEDMLFVEFQPPATKDSETNIYFYNNTPRTYFFLGEDIDAKLPKATCYVLNFYDSVTQEPARISNPMFEKYMPTEFFSVHRMAALTLDEKNVEHIEYCFDDDSSLDSGSPVYQDKFPGVIVSNTTEKVKFQWFYPK